MPLEELGFLAEKFLMRSERFSISLALLSLAFLSLLVAPSAVAGKMVFSLSAASESFDLNAQLDSENGVLSLDPHGNTTEPLRVDVLSSSGRSPASVGGQGSVIRSMLLSHPTRVQLNHRGPSARGRIQIRVSAP